MKKILVLTHGDFSKGIKSSVDVIAQDSSMIDTMCIGPSDTPATVRGWIEEYLMNAKDLPVFVLTDIPAGSTTTIISPYLEGKHNLYIVTGLNLGMLLAFALQPVEDGDVENNIRKILDDAKGTVLFVNDLLK